jgi:alkylation response protein AidB-like acyl-CoA dehydrogenase
VALATLSFERGASTLGQQMNFRQELDAIVAVARENGRIGDPLIRQRLADAWIGLEIQRYNALRTLSDSGEAANQAAMVTKLHWANWHRSLGKLAMDVLGPEAEIADEFPYGLNRLQRMYLFTRSDTIYGGSNQIQRNIIGERALGLPREPR